MKYYGHFKVLIYWKIHFHKVYVCVLSRVLLFVTPWTVSCQTPLSVEFPRQEYWGELPLLIPFMKFIKIL